MTDYRPISCEQYARYELWILRRQTLRLRWRDARGFDHLEAVRPLDLQTRAKAEYLVAERLSGERLTLRLDRILGSELTALGRSD